MTKDEQIAYFVKLEQVQKKGQGSFPYDALAACLRCGHWWKRRSKSLPKKCPRCLSKYWATLRRNRQGLRPAS